MKRVLNGLLPETKRVALEQELSIEGFASAVPAGALARAMSVSVRSLERHTFDLSRWCGRGRQQGDTGFDTDIHEIALLRTGFDALDDVLGGGLATGEVAEIIGPAAVGKSQLCLAIVANTVATSGAGVLFIDTCGGFSADRVYSMMQGFAPRQQRMEKRERFGRQLQVCRDCWAGAGCPRSLLERCWRRPWQVRRASNLASLLAVLQSVDRELVAADARYASAARTAGGQPGRAAARHRPGACSSCSVSGVAARVWQPHSTHVAAAHGT